ncbi:MAG: TonB-dependent receptor [Steroidobacteraceae bacterium]
MLKSLTVEFKKMAIACAISLSSCAIATAQNSSMAQSASDTSTQEGSSTSSPPALGEVIVTAQKIRQPILDVPVAVSVIDTSSLVTNNQVKLTNYYTEVPGLSVAPSTMSSETLSIRGITTGAVGEGPPNPAPTVAVTIDGVPYGGVGGGDQLVPDFDPGDLSSIEVLRGPQGTLFGASSLGGLVNFVTVDPSTSGIFGRLAVGTDSVYNGSELGYTARGSVNLPLSSDFAVRASVFTRQEPGYINDPVLGLKGVNEDWARGGFITALWQPSDTFSLKLNALYQTIKSNSTSAVTPNPSSIFGVPALGDLQQFFIRAVNNYGYDRKAEAFSAILKYKIGNAELTSLTGYDDYAVRDSFDLSDDLASFSEQYFGTVGNQILDSIGLKRITEELRLSAPLGKHFDGLLGVFYSGEHDYWEWNYPVSNPFTGAELGDWGTSNATDPPITYTEYSVFGDLTYHITHRFDIQIGGRETEIRIGVDPLEDTSLFASVIEGLPTTPYVFPAEAIKENAFTYLLTPRFKVTPDLMVYARLASGYRPGGSNIGTPTVPEQYRPDKTDDYELGAKLVTLHHALFLDGSLYYIDWKNIQLPLIYPVNGSTYVGNAAGAKSEGVELSAKSKSFSGLTVGAWATWDESVLTQTVPGAGQDGEIYGFAGDPLPNTPRFSGNVSLDYNFPIVGDFEGVVGGDESYVGYRLDAFSSVSAQRQNLPAYAKLNLHAGTTFKSWTVNFYVNNVFNRYGLISGGVGNAIPYAFYILQPRTVGVTVSKDF